nr:voltage-dependent N-type calcium channel subunit alpha-1B-like [Dermacentor andersoni]
MSHRASSSKPGDVLDLEIGSDDDDFLGEVKSPTCSAKPAAQRPQPPSLSAAGAARPLGASSQPDPTAQLQGDGSSGTASPSPEHRARKTGADRPGHPDLRDKLNLIRCHRRRKSKRRRSRSGGDLRTQLSDNRERADHDADEEPRAPTVGAPSGGRRAVFRGGSRAGNGGSQECASRICPSKKGLRRPGPPCGRRRGRHPSCGTSPCVHRCSLPASCVPPEPREQCTGFLRA